MSITCTYSTSILSAIRYIGSSICVNMDVYSPYIVFRSLYIYIYPRTNHGDIKTNRCWSIGNVMCIWKCAFSGKGTRLYISMCAWECVFEIAVVLYVRFGPPRSKWSSGWWVAPSVYKQSVGNRVKWFIVVWWTWNVAVHNIRFDPHIFARKEFLLVSRQTQH